LVEIGRDQIGDDIASNYTNQSIYIIILLYDQNETTSPYIALSFCKQNDNVKTNF
jgi:hypothetical protein